MNYEERPPSIPDYFQALGLGVRPTAAEVQQAFRRIASTVHPDKGGSVADFRELQKNYEMAMARVQFGQPLLQPTRPHNYVLRPRESWDSVRLKKFIAAALLVVAVFVAVAIFTGSATPLYFLAAIGIAVASAAFSASMPPLVAFFIFAVAFFGCAIAAIGLSDALTWISNASTSRHMESAQSELTWQFAKFAFALITAIVTGLGWIVSITSQDI